MIKNKIFKIFSILLNYPTENLKSDLNSIFELVKEEKLLSKENLLKFLDFFNYIKNNDLISLQETYVSIFDRQKNFSLYLFEHIHGDSRERGSAMLDLNNLYKKYNFEVKNNELPDYIPLFLEFISLIKEKEAFELLGEVINLVSIIRKRLENINSHYFIIFLLIEEISFLKPDNIVVEKTLISDKNSFNNYVDNDWEEKKVF